MRRRSVLAGALGAVGWAACGSSGGPALWFSYGGKNREALLALVERHNREQPAHAVTPVFQGDYFELLAKLRTAIHAGAPPAITHVVGEVLPYLASAGVLEPLDAAIAGATDGPSEWLSDAERRDFVPALTQEGAFDAPRGTPTYGIPFNRSTPIAYLNGDILGELGLDPPKTWDELRELARAASRGGGEGARRGFACPIDWWMWVALVGQTGGDLVEGDRITLGGEAGIRAVSLWKDLAASGHMTLPAGRDYNAWTVTNTEFLAQRAAMIWTSTAFVRYFEENAKFPVVAAPLPRDARFAVPTGGTFFVAPKGAPAEHRAAAASFLSFMSRADTTNEFATKTGYIPTTKAGVAELERTRFYDAHPNDRVAVRQLESVRPWPWHKDLFRIQREIVQPRLESAVLGGADARATLEEARRAAETEL
ncbi:MAG TPA: ABC transporter substrate-binding protein [Polyangiaceae bacterium]|nr:ABC transporter substrate-binding protein [Polyangiaceae bacterium]